MSNASNKAGSSRGTRARASLTGVSFILVCVSWLALSPAVAAAGKYRVTASSIPIAAGTGESSRFSLDSCIDQVMTGASTGGRFKLQTGCGAAFPVLPVAEGIPASDSWALWALALSIIMAAAVYLRAGNSRSF